MTLIRTKLSRLLRVIAVVIGGGVAAAVSAQPEGPGGVRPRPLADRQPLIVGASDDGFPYSFFNERGEPDGFAADVLDAIARISRLQLRRVSYPSKEMQARFRGGEFDLLQLLSQTGEREAYAEFTVPLLTLQGAVYVRRGGGIRQLADLNGRDFAIVGVGSIGETFLRDRGLKPRLLQVPSTLAAMKLIAAGKCDAVYMTQLTAVSLIRAHHLDQLVMLGDPVEGYDVRHCFAVHRGDAPLLARLNEGLAILHETGEFDRIYRKWFGRVSGVVFSREEITTYAAGFLAVAFAATLWIGQRQRTLRRRIEHLNAGLETAIARRTAELAARVAEVERLNADQQQLLQELRLSQHAAAGTAARLQETNDHLQAANHELEAFSYSVSHDLRSPLRNITGFVELLSRRLADPADPEMSRYVTVITAETQRMGELIDDLLEFSRFGQAPLTLGPVDLAELVPDVIGSLQSEVAGRKIEWRIGALPVVEADRGLLRHALVNLLHNAVKFTARRETAVIELGVVPATAGSGVTLFVRDNGVGFNPKYADKLFGVFQRLHNQRDFAGTGIGLANVKRIIGRHGGRVWAEARLDEGAAFFLTLNAASRASLPS